MQGIFYLPCNDLEPGEGGERRGEGLIYQQYLVCGILGKEKLKENTSFLHQNKFIFDDYPPKWR